MRRQGVRGIPSISQGGIPHSRARLRVTHQKGREASNWLRNPSSTASRSRLGQQILSWRSQTHTQRLLKIRLREFFLTDAVLIPLEPVCLYRQLRSVQVMDAEDKPSPHRPAPAQALPILRLLNLFVSYFY